MPLRRLVDSHCHLQDPRYQDILTRLLARASNFHVSHIGTCACFEDEWRLLAQFLRENKSQDDDPRPTVLPAFGVHPWWSNDVSGTYLEQLKEYLDQFPKAAIGEIGLCKSSRGRLIPLEQQERVFREQFAVASDFNRPVVIHCVGYYGKLLELLQKSFQKLPPTIILHSYGGSADMARAFTKLGSFYFSFSAKQLVQGHKKVLASCRSVPLHRLLIETDAPDQLPAINTDNLSATASQLLDPEHKISALNDPAFVQLAFEQLCTIREDIQDHDELAQLLYRNSLNAFLQE